ncbi:15915_t:CDS:2 [Racocetra fulgida]|uniref:15915_t:CDS:1 n=1 Tax=Racocetra fulgida TaxID=60492 RepID=A0A9N9AJ68_9GLOM|nr:15915_t:CDS:2 [Racocetra fulgida]
MTSANINQQIFVKFEQYDFDKDEDFQQSIEYYYFHKNYKEALRLSLEYIDFVESCNNKENNELNPNRLTSTRDMLEIAARSALRLGDIELAWKTSIPFVNSRYIREKNQIEESIKRLEHIDAQKAFSWLERHGEGETFGLNVDIIRWILTECKTNVSEVVEMDKERSVDQL